MAGHYRYNRLDYKTNANTIIMKAVKVIPSDKNSQHLLLSCSSIFGLVYDKMVYMGQVQES